MNKRLKKKSEKMRRKALHRILDLVLDINGLQESKKETTGNHPTASLRLAGHTASADVDIHPYGWESGANPEKWNRCYFDNCGIGDTPMQMAEKLKRYKEELSV